MARIRRKYLGDTSSEDDEPSPLRKPSAQVDTQPSQHQHAPPSPVDHQSQMAPAFQQLPVATIPPSTHRVAALRRPPPPPPAVRLPAPAPRIHCHHHPTQHVFQRMLAVQCVLSTLTCGQHTAPSSEPPQLAILPPGSDPPPRDRAGHRSLTVPALPPGGGCHQVSRRQAKADGPARPAVPL